MNVYILHVDHDYECGYVENVFLTYELALDGLNDYKHQNSSPSREWVKNDLNGETDCWEQGSHSVKIQEFEVRDDISCYGLNKKKEE